MGGDSPDRKVYRLRNLPEHVDRLSATQLVATVIKDVELSDIKLFSLAVIPDSWKRTQTKVATLMFTKTPSALLTPTTRGEQTAEWVFEVPGLHEPLILDTQFLGMTVLNQVNPSHHEYDCIVLSGLASHPFGSWQPKGDDKSFMWIRDVLPHTFPSVRFILYGYNTILANSKSFQTIVDLALMLISELEVNGWSSPGAKPLIFIAHSLGGVLLKQLLVMLADGNKRATFVRDIIKGVIFFGTPSVGMPLQSLLSIVESQPNKDFVEDLSDRSSFLKNLETQFEGIAYISKMRMFWVYETKTSPTVIRTDSGSYTRSGPRVVMVDKLSATAGRCDSDPESTVQIDEDHSGIVKFSPGDYRILSISDKIRKICWFQGESSRPTVESPILMPESSDSQLESFGDDFDVQAARFTENDSSSRWNYDLIMQSLQSPDRDTRLEQIDQNFRHTFNWAYDNPSVGLTQWLFKGSGIFWISGKPGSGKSTLMKFLLNDPRTAELLDKWKPVSKPASRQLVLNLFFHHRGTFMQKSFEGLLRSLVSQLLDKEPGLWSVVGEMLDAKLGRTLQSGTRGSLLTDIRTFCRASEIAMSIRRQEQFEVMLSRNPVKQLDEIFLSIFPECGKNEELEVKRTILNEYGALLDSMKGVDEPSKHNILNCETERIWRRVSSVWRGDFNLFKELVKRWFTCIDTESAITVFLTNHNLREGVSRGKDPGMLSTYIRDLATRHKIRQQTLLNIQLEPWTRHDIEGALNLIFDQELFALDLCLFFDALDEYDGRPEVISEFLKDLVTQSPSTQTKARVLFSSRPWPVFQEEFKDYPGFRLHEYTYEDIQEYCTGLLPHSGLGRSVLPPLIRDIAWRARGVFLWVRFVMRDLIMIVTASEGYSQDISLKLRHCLDSIPAELHDYYEAIIQRLPSDTRSETYALLECISRSSEMIFLHQVPQLIGCALSQSPGEARKGWRHDRNMDRNSLEVYVRTISGGLVELVAIEPGTPGTFSSSSSESGYQIQLLHQTCKEWVESATFKHIVLGNRASMMWENGHSFLAKFYCFSPSRWTVENKLYLFAHLREAERTTGVSQYIYLSRLNSEFYDEIFYVRKGETKSLQTSALSLAINNGLWLCLKDAIKHDQNAFRNTSEPLVDFLLDEWSYITLSLKAPMTQNTSELPEVIRIGRFLLEHGFNLNRDTGGVSRLITHLWQSPDKSTAQLYIDMFIYAMKKELLSTGMLIPSVVSKNDTSIQMRPLLNLSPPPLARWLLQSGADVNRLGSYGETPLDDLIHRGSIHRQLHFGVDWLYESVCILAEHGGTLKFYNSQHFESFITTEFAQRGIDISTLAAFQKRLDLETRKQDRLVYAKQWFTSQSNIQQQQEMEGNGHQRITNKHPNIQRQQEIEDTERQRITNKLKKLFKRH